MKFHSGINCFYKISSNYDLNPKKENKYIIINCEECLLFKRNAEKSMLNSRCFNNLVKIFTENPKLSKCILKTRNGNVNLTTNQIELISNYSQTLIDFLKMKTPVLKEKKDCIKRTECANKWAFFFERILGNKFNEGLILTDPILGYTEITQELVIYKKLSNKRNKCANCFYGKIQYLEKIKNLLNKSLIIRKYSSLYNKNQESSALYSLILEDYKTNYQQSEKEPISIESNQREMGYYKKGPYKIKIFENLHSKELFYKISSIIDDPNLKKIYERLILELKNKPKEFFDYEKPHKLDDLLRYKINYMKHLIKQEFGYLSLEMISDLAEITVFEILNLNPFMALLIDDEIEEIFLDSPKSHIYLDHRQFGRCKTDLSFNSTEIESFKTRIRLEAEQRLDEIKPFLKTEVITKYFHVRASLQIYPLSIDGFSMSIRKLQKNNLTIIDLLENGTLTKKAAAYLLFNYIHGRCILVIGEPYSGKTTLINSLDLIGKRQWRKVYLEDVVESIDQSPFHIHQIRFQVEPISEDSKNSLMKPFQVKECLHRTPDAIFIGEIIHKQAAESFFFILKVGLRRCLATAHGESPELMVERFLYDDQIPSPLISNLDIIVQMNRIDINGKIIRRVSRITEIQKTTQDDFLESVIHPINTPNIRFVDIFLRDPKNDILVPTFNSINELYMKSETINKINLLRTEFISETDLQIELEKILDSINNLLKNKNNELCEIVTTFQNLWQNLEGKVYLRDLTKISTGVERQ